METQLSQAIIEHLKANVQFSIFWSTTTQSKQEQYKLDRTLKLTFTMNDLYQALLPYRSAGEQIRDRFSSMSKALKNVEGGYTKAGESLAITLTELGINSWTEVSESYKLLLVDKFQNENIEDLVIQAPKYWAPKMKK